jgi:DNA replication protein DnaC
MTNWTPLGDAAESAKDNLTVRPNAPMPPVTRVPLIGDAGVPPRFMDLTLDNYLAQRPDQVAALTAARAVLDEHRGMFLTGPVGTGKTHIAVGLVAALAVQGRLFDDFGRAKARFVVVPELLDAIRAGIGHDFDDPLDPLLRIPLLILDDLGAEKPTEWVVDRLYVLVNARYNAMLVTVATSNFTLNQLADRGYERIVSRLCHGASVVELDGPDERMR